MTNSADAFIQALRRRMQLVPQLRRPPGQFPPGWQQWLDQLGPGAGTGARAREVVEVLAARPPAMRPRRPELAGRWSAVLALFRQQWDPPPRDQRSIRVASGIFSALWHLGLAALLIWLMALGLLELGKPPPQGEESVVMIEFIGDGTPELVGGGAGDTAATAEPQPRPESGRTSPRRPASSAARPAPTPAVVPEPLPAAPEPLALPPQAEAPQLPLPQPELVQRDVPNPVPSQQSVTVSEPIPDVAEFVLPPPAARAPALTMPELSAPSRALEVAELPAPLPSPPVAPVAPPVRAPELALPEARMVEREVPMPQPVVAPELPRADLPRPTVSAPELTPRQVELRTRNVPAPTISEPAAVVAAGAAAADTAPAARPEPSTAETGQAAVTPPATRAGSPAAVPTPATGIGPRPETAPGAWASPARGDDWAAAARERAGGQRGQPPGVFNSDGSVRLAEQPGSASAALPPGTITEEIADLDRAGTWLRRKPNDYEPTAFDEYWRPNESLLEEWVRRSVTTIRIPIPGTTKSIVCQTVLLALGGGCTVNDPNLNNQPARARPAPDIPFKPELQEGNGSRGAAPGS